MPILRRSVTRAGRVGLRGLILSALLSGVVPSLAGAAGEPSKPVNEYDLKAAFLFNFAQFVDWPSKAFPTPETPITIGILGDDPFGHTLNEIVANEAVRSRRLIVRRFRSVEEIGPCHILFINPSESMSLPRILAALRHRSILTVGETPDFATRSGMIGFVVSDNRLRLRINLAAARAARLTISSKLLRQAQIVGSDVAPE